MNKKTTIIILFITSVLFSGFTQKFKEHSVKDGENLYRISRQYDISLGELCKINNIPETAQIKKGTVLKIPDKLITKNYEVEKGDNLFRIGLKYNITVDKLCEINNFTESVVLFPGKVIKVPVEDKVDIKPSNKVQTSSVKEGNTVLPRTSSPEITINSSQFNIHVMQKGETLYQISKRYKSDIKSIQSLNKITDATVLKPGMKLKIPKKAIRKNFIDYDLPLKGKVIPYVKSHYRGVLVFSTENDKIVKSVDDGIVSYIDMRSGYGLIVFIKHSNGLVSTYSGFSEIYVKNGVNIKSGDAIGKAGSVSKQTDPAILFSLQDGSKALGFDMNTGKFYK